MIKFRDTYVLAADGTETKIEFEDLKKGDKFKLVEQGHEYICIASGTPAKCSPEGNWEIPSTILEIREVP